MIIQFKPENERYYSNNNGIYKIVRKKGRYSILEGFSLGEKQLLLAEDVRISETHISWEKSEEYLSRQAAEKALRQLTQTKHTNIAKGRSR